MADFDFKKNINIGKGIFTNAESSGTGEGGLPRYTSSAKRKLPLIITLIVLFFVIIILSQALVVTKENEYTLIKEFGKVERIIDTAGLSLKTPFIQTSDTLPKTLLLYDLSKSDVIT